MSVGLEWRLNLYKELAARLNDFFAVHVGAYCVNCARVTARLPEARDEAFELLEGVYPGCCHRGAGEVYRLEGQPPERSRLAPVIIAGLERERALVLSAPEIAAGGVYTIRKKRDRSLLTGGHCRYFTPDGCCLGVLKGPLCINFVCPPLRDDLLAAGGGEVDLIGPENDFLFIYRTLAAISWDDRPGAEVEFAGFCRRLERLRCRCRDFLAARNQATLYDFFMPTDCC